MKQHKLDHTLPHSIVFYDHSCGICRIEMRKLKKRDHLERLHLVDISSPKFEPKLWGIEYSAVAEQLHVRIPSGSWLTGIAAIRHVYDEVGLGWIWWSTKLPIVNYFSQRAYGWFARNRMDISNIFSMNSQSALTCESCKNNKAEGVQR